MKSLMHVISENSRQVCSGERHGGKRVSAGTWQIESGIEVAFHEILCFAWRSSREPSGEDSA